MFSNKSEIVRSFKTKSLAVAQVEVDRLNKWFDERVSTVGYSKNVGPRLPAKMLSDINEDMKLAGDHPDVVPVINAQSEQNDLLRFVSNFGDLAIVRMALERGEATPADFLHELNAYGDTSAGKLINFQLNRDHLRLWLHKKYTNQSKYAAELSDPEIDCDAEGYLPPQLKWIESDPEVIRYKIMMGENLVPPPTWQNATDSYIRQYARSKKQRNPEQLVKHRKSTEKLCIRFSAHLSAGMLTPLKEIDTQDVEAFVDGAGVSDSTNAKNLTIFRAVWNSWNKHNAKQKVEGDPFVVAVNDSKEAANTSAKIRRSMIPSEFDYFCTSIANEPDPEVQMIGKIMAYCGAPTIEAAKLQRSDVKLDSAVPYIVFRSTKDSITGKDRLDRAVPLVGALLDDLRDYVRDHYISGKRGSLETQRLFPSLGYGIHSASMRSKVLKRHVKNLRPTDPKLLSPYSLRHTFKDRASKAGVRTDIAEYLHGHKSKQSSAIHRKYGTKMPASETVDLMLLINGVSEWGFIEDYDE
ncbi:tyrosine-type recombinase/integrase [Ascidiaceihabitans sp.]|nr:tyrosine-type recombinase/integrase [Ascidiaceihabitans sp.]